MNASEIVDDILIHYGRKGMKWGVRKSYSVGAGGTRTKVKTRSLRKTKVKVRGGRSQPAHSEAIIAREAQRVLKKSGVNALSNQQLQMLQTRLNLEQNVSRLSKTRTNSAGKKWVADELKKVGKKGAAAAAAAA